MKRFAIILSVALISTAASARPINDTKDWAQQFTQAALKNDTDALLALMSEVAAPELNLSGMPQLLQSAKAVIGHQNADFAEQFGEQNVGTFLKRINIAVSYPSKYIFYSVTFGRHADGWVLYGFKIDGNINNVITAPWPS